jgi:hypothetical protein
VRLWASYNDGGTWAPATLDHPANPVRQNVSLRIQATDAGGSSINQTIIRAYGLE